MGSGIWNIRKGIPLFLYAARHNRRKPSHISGVYLSPSSHHTPDGPIDKNIAKGMGEEVPCFGLFLGSCRTRPGNIQLYYGEILEEQERDLKRAEYIRNRLAKIEPASV